MKLQYAMVLLVAILLSACAAKAPTESAPAATTTEPVEVPAEVSTDLPAAEPVKAAPGKVEVSMTSRGFDPAAVTVKAGDTVKWVNNDDLFKLIAPAGGMKIFKGQKLDPGESFEYTFESPGEYNIANVEPFYFTGAVVVESNE